MNVSLVATVGEVNTNVKVIRAQLDKAKGAAYFWNISSFFFGAAGVVIGVIALYLEPFTGRGPEDHDGNRDDAERACGDLKSRTLAELAPGQPFLHEG